MLASRRSKRPHDARRDRPAGFGDLLSYWYSAVTVRRGAPPPLAPYQRRPAGENPQPVQHVESYHPIPFLPYGAYELSPHLQILQTFPFSGHTYPFPVDIAMHPVERMHRRFPALPLAFGRGTLPGPDFTPLQAGDYLLPLPHELG